MKYLFYTNKFIKPGSKHHRRKTVGIVQRRGLARFRRAAKIVIIMLRAGGVLHTHKHEYVDPVTFWFDKKSKELLCF